MAQFNELPKFQLTRVFSNGTSQAPELHALDGINANCRMGRRGFLMTSAFSAGALASLSACDALILPTMPSVEPCTPNNPRIRENLQRWKGEPMAAPQGVITDPNDESLRAHPGKVTGLSFSRDGKLLASVCFDSAPRIREHIKIWSVESAELLQTIDPPDRAGLSIAFSPHDDYLIMSNGNQIEIRRINADAKPPAGKAIAVGPKDEYPFHSRVSNNGRRMVIRYASILRVLDLPQGNIVRVFTTFSGDMALNFDGSMLAVAEERCALTVYSVSSGDAIFRWDVPLRSVDFSVDGKLLAGRVGDQLVWWDIPSGKFHKSLSVPSSALWTTIRFCPNGKWLAVPSREQEQDDILVFRAPYGAAVWRLRSSVPNGSAIAFSPDSRWLATGSSKGHVTLWDLETGELPRRLVDIAAVTKDTSIRVMEIHGRKEYVGKCGDPLPPGAICTCNCVPGTFLPPDQLEPRATPNQGPTWGGVETCTCDQICTCVPIK